MASLLALAAFALLIARVMGLRGAWRWILAAVAAAMLGAQLLPAGNAFRAEAAAWGQVLFWLGLGLLPVAVHAGWVRSLRRRTGVDAPPPPAPARPQGLVQFPQDAALAAELAAALLAEAPGARLTLGWRGADGALEGALRLRFAGDLAEVELFRVEPAARGRGVGGRLLAAAETEAAGRGSKRIGALVDGWQEAGLLERRGYLPRSEAGGRRWLEKTLGGRNMKQPPEAARADAARVPAAFRTGADVDPAEGWVAGAGTARGAPFRHGRRP